MRLRTKLVLTATGLTFAMVLVLSSLFLGELMRQRVEQTYAANDVLAHEVLLATRAAVEVGLRAHPPAAGQGATDGAEDADSALHQAVLDALRSSDALGGTMNGIVRYSPTVEDVSVTDAHGFTMVSTDPDALNQRAGYRTSFSQVRDGSLPYQLGQVFGRPRVLDIAAPLDRNGLPFLVVHVGVRSTFLRNSYAPWLRAAAWFALLAMVVSVVATGVLSAAALRPLVTIGDELERLALGGGEARTEESQRLLEAPRGPSGLGDPVGRVNRSLDRLGREMRSREEGYTALQANMAQMLDTLRDGVLLFAADGRAVMISDAAAHFIGRASGDGRAGAPEIAAMVGMRLEEIFAPDTALGAAVGEAFRRAAGGGAAGLAATVMLEDGRQVQISLDRIGDGGAEAEAEAGDARAMGTMLTLRDTGSARELEQEMEVARRLAAIGRLTANVGHEVKNPINAMVVHLELLRGKLSGTGGDGGVDRDGAQRHVEILADEMHRLDRVVETLADFSRPMELDLREHDLRRVIEQVLDLCGAELEEHGVHVAYEAPALPLPVLVDAGLLRQALLNLLLNAMQAMPAGGTVRMALKREQRTAVVEIADDGEGIPPDVLPRIFDLYFTTKAKGSGIGLAMTYRILQLHGGEMEVRSQAEAEAPARGTTFTLRIPVSVAPVGEGRRLAARTGSQIDADAGGEAECAEAMAAAKIAAEERM